MQQNQNALLIQYISKSIRQQGFIRKSEQMYNSLAWEGKFTLVVFEICILHYHDVTLHPCYWHQGLHPGRIRPWPHAEHQLARPPSPLYSMLQYTSSPHWSSPQTANIPPSPNYLNKQPGHSSGSLKIMVTWPWLAYSDILAVYLTSCDSSLALSDFSWKRLIFSSSWAAINGWSPTYRHGLLPKSRLEQWRLLAVKTSFCLLQRLGEQQQPTGRPGGVVSAPRYKTETRGYGQSHIPDYWGASLHMTFPPACLNST